MVSYSDIFTKLIFLEVISHGKAVVGVFLGDSVVVRR